MKRMKCAAAALALALALAGCSGGSPLMDGAASSGPAASAPASGASSAAADSAAPVPLGEFSADTLSGETLDQTVFEGHDLTVVNVWATFCGPCKEEMPVLAALDGAWEEDVQILGIVTDVVDQEGRPDQAQIDLAVELARAAGTEYDNLILNQSLAQLGFAGLQAVPATLFVDGEGNLVGQGFYGALDEENWRSVIEERLAQARAQMGR